MIEEKRLQTVPVLIDYAAYRMGRFDYACDTSSVVTDINSYITIEINKLYPCIKRVEVKPNPGSAVPKVTITYAVTDGDDVFSDLLAGKFNETLGYIVGSCGLDYNCDSV